MITGFVVLPVVLVVLGTPPLAVHIVPKAVGIAVAGPPAPGPNAAPGSARP